MLNAWLEIDGVADLLGSLSEVAGIDLVALGTTADAETIKDTSNAQPLIVATSLVSHRVLGNALATIDIDPHSVFDLIGGHSVGEYAATAISGVLTDHDAIALVATRGRAMAQAAAQTPTGMVAVVGGDPDEVEAALIRHGLQGANYNGAGQLVAAGPLDGIEALQMDAPTRSRVIPLQVAGAFHTHYMESALSAVGEAAGRLNPATSTLEQLTNRDGSTTRDGQKILETLVSQITHPVRWDACQQTISQRAEEAGSPAVTVELAPGGVLTGLARRTIKPGTHVAIKSPGDLDAAVTAIADAVKPQEQA